VNGDDFRGERYGGASPGASFFTPPLSTRSQETTKSLASSTRVETGQPDTPPVRCFPDIDKMVHSFASGLEDESSTTNYSATEDTTEFPDEDEERQPQEAVLTDDSAGGVLHLGQQLHDNEGHSESYSNSDIPATDFDEKEDDQVFPEDFTAGEIDEEFLKEQQTSRNSAPAVFEEPESNVGIEELATDRYEPSPEFLQEEVEESDPGAPDKGLLLKEDEKNVEAVPTEEDDSYSAGDEEEHAAVVKEFEPVNESMIGYPTDEELMEAAKQEKEIVTFEEQEPISAEEEYEKYARAKRESSLCENVGSEMETADAAGPSEFEAASEINPMGTTHILILTTSMGMNNRNQHRGLQLLDALGFSYETLDGADPANKDIRLELFRISGMCGVYPLFFLVKDTFEQTENPVEFLGDWETVEGINDSSSLPKEILDANPGILTWDKIPGLVRNKS